MNKIITTLVGAGLLAASLAPAALAAVPIDPATRDAHITLTVARTEGETERVGIVHLDCPGTPGQGHPYTAKACADLHAAGGDFDRLPGTDRAICSNDAAPVSVTARGTYRGRSVHWEHTYENDCARQLATGLVFQF
ncbi:SSI family serine proteinase inhibitor [Streptomyces sp. NPDC053792]|uniref:SSI family serine proteinase inhibitor n=1 Tax=Streptomyces sp. NPDC053792 TaxID=3365716 RepID=UPI0037D45F9F